MKLEIFGVNGMGEIQPGDDLALEIAKACDSHQPASSQLQNNDVLVVTQKIVSKAEGQLVDVATDSTSQIQNSNKQDNNKQGNNKQNNKKQNKNQQNNRQPNDSKASKHDIIQNQSARILRQRGDLIISETHHGFVCANAGVDFSNVPDGKAALLPKSPDRSAWRIKEGLSRLADVEVAVVVSDTFGRPWRHGLTDVAIGCAGIKPLLDFRGQDDALGRELVVTQVAIVDEIASAAELVMGKSDRVPVAVVRGVPEEWLIASKGAPNSNAPSVTRDLVRSHAENLFF